jgi:CubicO group peptidase (beta-lactamase class C family)
MNSHFGEVDQLLRNATPNQTPAAQLAIRHHGELIFSSAYGWLDPVHQQQATQRTTRFDLASVTKLFVATTFLRLVEQGWATLEQPVGTVLPNFVGKRPIQLSDTTTAANSAHQVDPAQVTFRHLLTHTAGLPAGLPLFRQADRATAQQMALTSPFAYVPGERIIYSDIGLILLGLAVEAISGVSLDEAVNHEVIEPLALTLTGYRPATPENVAPTEYCQWRGRRVCGEVHDENAAFLGGVSGHAGLFSTAQDVAALGQSFLDQTLLQPATIAEMTRLQAEYEDTRRGLGFALWSADPAASSNPFSPSAYGHTGFTGTTLWVDPERALVVAFLTNEVYHGRQDRKIAALRVATHRAVVAAIDELAG